MDIEKAPTPGVIKKGDNYYYNVCDMGYAIEILADINDIDISSSDKGYYEGYGDDDEGIGEHLFKKVYKYKVKNREVSLNKIKIYLEENIYPTDEYKEWLVKSVGLNPKSVKIYPDEKTFKDNYKEKKFKEPKGNKTRSDSFSKTIGKAVRVAHNGQYIVEK